MIEGISLFFRTSSGFFVWLNCTTLISIFQDGRKKDSIPWGEKYFLAAGDGV